ncbi:MAG: hypothetical protein ACP5NZ_01295 [Nanobdellota archaeon]
MKTKILKIKIGTVFIGNKSVDVFQEAWQKESKDGKTIYYEMRVPIFVHEVEKKSKENVTA